MNVPVQFYAQLRDLAGTSEMAMEIPPGSTANDLLHAIYQHVPALRAQDKSILIGAGVEFVERSYVIKSGDIIAIMPPVQGG